MRQVTDQKEFREKTGFFIKILLMVYALTPGSLSALNGGLDGLRVEFVFLAAGIGTVLWITREEKISKNKWLRILCGFFAFTTVLGMSYHELADWDYLFGSFPQFLLALVVMAGYYFLYSSLIVLGSCIPKYRKGIQRREAKGAVEQFLFEKQPFWGPFFFAMICALPYVFSFFPGVIQADAFEQLWKYMGVIENDNKHPVVSTALMGRCLAFGRTVLGSDNLGICTYTMLQSLLQWTGIAYLMYILKKMKTPVWIRWFGLLFLTVLPLFPMWGYTVAKDTQYYISLLYFCVSFADMLIDGTEKRKHWKQIVFCCASYGMILTRKEGRFLLAVSLVCLFIYYKKQWKLYLFTIVTGFSILFAVEEIYMPAHNIPQGNIAEALSILTQQTARYQRDHSEDVTEWEHEVLSELFDDYDQLGTAHYTPEISDASKFQILGEPTKEQLRDYLKVCFSQFFRHPDTCIQAIFNQTYGYFYMDRKDTKDPPIVENTIGREQLSADEFYMEVGFLPQRKAARDFLVGLTHTAAVFPLISLLYNAGFHGYVLIGCVVYLMAAGKHKRILLMMPTILVFAVCILSPVNGYLRYMLPVMVMLPLNLAWCAYREKDVMKEKEEK